MTLVNVKKVKIETIYYKKKLFAPYGYEWKNTNKDITK